MEGFLPMKGKVLNSSCMEASKMIAIVVFVGLPLASFLRVYAKPLYSSLALWMFRRRHRHRHHRHRNDSGTTKVEEEIKEEEDDQLGQLEELDCAVCLCPVSGGEKFRLLACNHRFHGQCIEAWLRARATCPLCRNPSAPLSLRHRNDHQQRRFFDGLLFCFQNLCKWMENPLNSELSPALYENSNYLF